MLAGGTVLALAVAACGSGGGPSTGAAGTPHASAAHAPAATPVPANSGPRTMLGAHSLPEQASQTLPAFPAFYDAHEDVVVVTDGYPKAAASAFHANFAPSLSSVKPMSQPAWYVVRGRAAAGQLAVLGSEPGEDDYSPLWRTVVVRWQPGVTPKVLTSDNMILNLAKKGELTTTRTSMVVNAPVITKP